MERRITKHRANLFIDPELWRAFRLRAFEVGRTATDILDELMRAYLAKPAPKRRAPRR